MNQPETKQIGAVLEIKDEDKGEVEAVFATIGVMDKYGDVIAEGAIKDGSKVKLSSYGHDAVWGAIPVGKGAVHVEGDQAVLKGRFFLSTVRGRETFDVLKEFGKDQEWSFGFRVLGSETPDEADRQKGVWRILTKLDVYEVSPVLRGAGVGTHTVAVKEADNYAETRAAEAAAAQEEAGRVTAEAKAADDARVAEAARTVAAALQLKEQAAAAAEEYARVCRTLKRLGVA